MATEISEKNRPATELMTKYGLTRLAAVCGLMKGTTAVLMKEAVKDDNELSVAMLAGMADECAKALIVIAAMTEHGGTVTAEDVEAMFPSALHADAEKQARAILNDAMKMLRALM